MNKYGYKLICVCIAALFILFVTVLVSNNIDSKNMDYNSSDITSNSSSIESVNSEIDLESEVNSVIDDENSSEFETNIESDPETDTNYDSEDDFDNTSSEEIVETPSSSTTTGGKWYTDYELDLLARIISAEAGCYWLSDEHQMMVGCVVLNRVNHPLFPNTIYDVIYQPGQYPPAYNGMLYSSTPDARTYENARRVLDGEYTCPSNVVFQAGFVQGHGVYMEIYDETLGTTTYFCYTNY